MFNKKTIFTILSVSILSSFCNAYRVDHTCTDLRVIPQSAIQNAKDTLYIAYGHTSHGSQLIDGMRAMIPFINNHGLGLNYPANFFWFTEDPAETGLHLDDYAMAGDVGYYPQWVNETRNYLNNPANSNVNVIVWSWCGQAAWYTRQMMIDQYLAPMNQLELDYPDVKFVYMTCHLDGTGANGNLNQRNEQIRNYCIANNKILYDFADIESYNPDGLINYMPLMCNDNCDYDSDGNGSLDKNWAIAWQNSHQENKDWYSCYAAHSQSLNGNRKAYAAWYLWARLAGWNPQCSCQCTADFNCDCKVDLKDLAELTQNWGTAVVKYDIAPDGGDGVIDILDLQKLAEGWMSVCQ